MENSKIVQGSVVRLKSGGHKMTVESIRGNDEAECVWFPPVSHFAAAAETTEPTLFAEKPQKQMFPLAVLAAVEP
jgi:uncharacterized protein YodC (DUF2158 family)